MSPRAYGEWDGLHEKLAWARANAPLAIAENEKFDSFWAVTRHADVMEVSKNNALFASGIRPTVLTDRDGEAIARAITPDHDGHLIRSLVQMDAPDHMKYRLLTQSWFMPKNLRTIEARIREIARETVEKMLATGGECDFAKDVAAGYPLHVVMNILGVPAEDEPRMLMLTQQLFGPTDPEINRARAEITSAEQAIQMLQFVIADFENYFSQITADRRKTPRDDLATVIANGQVHGQPIPDREANGYYMIVATAGHDTTSASTAGAIMELAKNPAAVRALPRWRGGYSGADRGSDPLVHAGSALHALGNRRCRARRSAYRQGRLADALLHECQPRRGRLRRSLHLQPGSCAQQPDRLRLLAAMSASASILRAWKCAS